MSTTTIQVRLSKELKQNAKIIFSDMGMTVSEGIRALLSQAVVQQQLSSTSKSPKTLIGLDKALQDIKDGKVKYFNTFEEFEVSWN